MAIIDSKFVADCEQQLSKTKSSAKSNDAMNSLSPLDAKTINSASVNIVCNINNTYAYTESGSNIVEYKNCVVVLEDLPNLKHLELSWGSKTADGSNVASPFIDLRIKNCPSLEYIKLPETVRGKKYVETVNSDDSISGEVSTLDLGHIVMIVSDATIPLSEGEVKKTLKASQNPLHEGLGINGLMSGILVVWGGTKEIEIIKDGDAKDSNGEQKYDRIEKFVKEPFVVYYEAKDQLLDSAVITRSLASVDFKDIVVDVIVVDEQATTRENPLKRSSSLASAPSIISSNSVDLSEFAVAFISKRDPSVTSAYVGTKTKAIYLDGFSNISNVASAKGNPAGGGYRMNPANMLDCVSLSGVHVKELVLNVSSVFFGISNSEIDEVVCTQDVTKIFVQDAPIGKFTTINTTESHMYGIRKDNKPMIEHLVLNGTTKTHSGFMEDEFVSSPEVSGTVVDKNKKALYIDPAVGYSISLQEIKALDTNKDSVRIQALLNACSDATEPENVSACLNALGMLLVHKKANIKDIWASRQSLAKHSLVLKDETASNVKNQSWYWKLPQVDPYDRDKQNQIKKLKIESAWISDLMICIEAAKANISDAKKWMASLDNAYAPIQMYAMIAITTSLYNEVTNSDYAYLGQEMLRHIIESSNNFKNQYETFSQDWKTFWQSEMPFNCLGVSNIRINEDERSFNQLFQNVQGTINTSNFAFKQHAYYIEAIFTLLALDQYSNLYNLNFDLKKAFAGNQGLLDKEMRKKTGNSIISGILALFPYDQNMVQAVTLLTDVNTNMEGLASRLNDIMERQGADFSVRQEVLRSYGTTTGADFSGRLEALSRGLSMRAISNPYDDDDDDDDDDDRLFSAHQVRFRSINRR